MARRLDFRERGPQHQRIHQDCHARQASPKKGRTPASRPPWPPPAQGTQARLAALLGSGRHALDGGGGGD
eukprot:1292586-Pyramimonas_sp.AAC.1